MCLYSTGLTVPQNCQNIYFFKYKRQTESRQAASPLALLEFLGAADQAEIDELFEDLAASLGLVNQVLQDEVYYILTWGTARKTQETSEILNVLYK